jgi:pSer/pThr/pTyr-binding forkhead associated (FHA) protein
MCSYGESDLETNEKFCPVCKNKNERYAVFCKHCGALLGYHPWDSSATTVNTDALEKGTKIAESLIDEALIPEDNIAIFAAGASKPIYLHVEEKLVFGRKSDQTFEAALLDLTELGGYQMGISRRHAVIQKLEKGYEVTDLGSTNGSWLNDERLVPFKPYPLASGSQLRFGRMRLLVLYHPVTKDKKAV